MHVGICIPSGDLVHAQFAISLAALVRHTPPDITLSIFNQRQSLICDSRNRLAARALEAECDWLLWLDSDMAFPGDALVRLLSHRVMMVGAAYARRAPPYGEVGAVDDDPEHDPVKSAADGLTEMKVMPFGCMLTHANLFARDVPPPWFQTVYRDDAAPVGEDAFFCRAVRERDGDVWRDSALSLQVGHIGSHEFRLTELVKPKVEVAA